MKTSSGLRERTSASRKRGGWCLVPKDIRGAIIVAQGLQGLKTSVMNCSKSWDRPVGGCGKLPFSCSIFNGNQAL